VGQTTCRCRPLSLNIQHPLYGDKSLDRYGSFGSAAPVRLIELLTYRLHRMPIGVGKL